jgi:hypothetical protein
MDLLYMINGEIPFADRFGYYWTSDRGESGAYLCVSFGVAEGEGDGRLTKIGLRRVRGEDGNDQGYAVFEMKGFSAEVSRYPLRGYLIRVYEKNARDLFSGSK